MSKLVTKNKVSVYTELFNFTWAHRIKKNRKKKPLQINDYQLINQRSSLKFYSPKLVPAIKNIKYVPECWKIITSYILDSWKFLPIETGKNCLFFFFFFAFVDIHVKTTAVIASKHFIF